MNQTGVLDLLNAVGAVITESHIVYTSGKHGSAYVNKDALYTDPESTSHVCFAMAQELAAYPIDVVVAPAVGGTILSQWVAFHLGRITGRRIGAAYAEHEEQSIAVASDGQPIIIPLPFEWKDERDVIEIQDGGSLIIRKSSFVFKRGYDKIVVGKNVAVVEDVLTTGGSARKTVEATRAAGGEVVVMAVICNRGGVKEQDVGDVPRLNSLLNLTLQTYEEKYCPLCASGVPINTAVGKGKQFLQRKANI